MKLKQITHRIIFTIFVVVFVKVLELDLFLSMTIMADHLSQTHRRRSRSVIRCIILSIIFSHPKHRIDIDEKLISTMYLILSANKFVDFFCIEPKVSSDSQFDMIR